MKKYIKPTTAVYEMKLGNAMLTGSNPSFDMDAENGADAGDSFVREEFDDTMDW